jgi:hypothetical protein
MVAVDLTDNHYLWTNQELQSKDKNNLYRNRCNKSLSYGHISDCKNFKYKSKCWEIYEGVKNGKD